MDNFSEILKLFTDKKNDKEIPIPKELSDQYPYGKFPIQYTKTGQEKLRRESESRFSYKENIEERPTNDTNNNLDISSFLPIIQVMSSGKKNPQDIMKIFSKILFKDHPEYEKLFTLFTKHKPQEFAKKDDFPNTNKIQISSLKRIN